MPMRGVDADSVRALFIAGMCDSRRGPAARAAARRRPPAGATRWARRWWARSSHVYPCEGI